MKLQILFFFLSLTVVVAQPRINGFTPLTGNVGSSVTISGSNFSATAASNIVYFGSVRANVTSASSTQLVVTVPGGASYSPISVTVGGLIGYSSQNFLVTFPGGGAINSGSFASPLNTATLDPLYRPATGDLDNDGKVDIIVTDQNNNAIVIYPNTTNAVNTVSLASPLTIQAESSPSSIAVVDLDGDGKLDLAVTNNGSNRVTVFRNTSVTGTISFATGVAFDTGSNPEGIAAGDFNSDGKSDLVIANYGSSFLTIFRNTSSLGSISFASQNLTSLMLPKNVQVGDIDNDGKFDIVSAGDYNSQISVFRNTSTSATITFSRVDLSTDDYPEKVSLGDLDNDGKLDLVIAFYNQQLFRILKNNSTSGNITAASFSSISITANYPKWVELADIDGNGRIDVVTCNDNWQIMIHRNSGTGTGIVSSHFSESFERAIDVKYFTLADINTDGKPDLVIVDTYYNYLDIHRNITGTASAPAISGFSPNSGSVGTTVTISGSNFSSTPSQNTVTFNGVAATVTAATSTSLTVTVPSGATTGTISVTVNGQSVVSSSSFTVTSPTVSITDFLPSSGSAGTQVYITGKNFSSVPANNVVRFNGVQAVVTSSSQNLIVVTVPVSATSGKITVTTAGTTATSTYNFVINTSAPSGIDLELSYKKSNVNYFNTANDKVYPGQSITLEYEVINRGTIDLTHNSSVYFILLDSDNNSRFLKFIPLPPIEFSDRVYNSTVLKIPTDVRPGNCTILMMVDADEQIVEANENNNIALVNFNVNATSTNPFMANLSTTFPEYLFDNTSSNSDFIEASITVPSNLTISRIFLGYKGISEMDSSFRYKSLTPNSTGYYTEKIFEDKFDEMGLEYFFEIYDQNSNLAVCEHGYSYIKYPNGVKMFNLKFGSEQKNYRIFSMPFILDQPSVDDLFSQELGPYNVKNWRVFNYSNGKNIEYKNGFNNIEYGKAYWFIAKQEKDIYTPSCVTPKYNGRTYFSIDLKKGWNQVGNPFYFTFNWEDAKYFSNLINGEVGNPKFHYEKFEEYIDFYPYEGAFVFADEDETIYIPVYKNYVSNIARVGKIEREKQLSTLDQESWEVAFKVNSGGLEYVLGGIGMHPQAKESKDKFDEMTLPRFGEFIEVNFNHSEYFHNKFTRDIVPTSESHVWDFTVESNVEDPVKVLSWDNSYFGNSKNIYLLDISNQRVVNMKDKDTYTFNCSSSNSFRVIFGDYDFVQENINASSVTLGNIFPNPVLAVSSVPFFLPGENQTYHVNVSVFNASGFKVDVLTDENYSSGYHELSFNRKDLPKGMYFIKLNVTGQGTTEEQIKKVIVE
ncbi:MAG: FG-GAP-like repeat-containing protein [Cytophagaceae bacterium]